MQYECARAIEVKKIADDVVRKTFSDTRRKGLNPDEWQAEMRHELQMMEIAGQHINVPKVFESCPFHYDMQYCGEPFETITIQDLTLIKNMERDIIHKSNLYHNDIKPSNVLRKGEKIYFIDFGHASFDKPKHPALNHLDLVDFEGDLKDEMRAIVKRLASNANSHGTNLSYYDLDGEKGVREWEGRWKVLRNAFVWDSLRILDLGCNQGVFTSSIAREFCPAFVMGVDATEDIIKAANYHALIEGVPSYFKHLNIANGDRRNKKYKTDSNWQEELGYNWDIVTALSLYHWVEDKEDLLRYLTRFPRVLIECHNDKELAEIKDYFTKKGYAHEVLNSGSSEFYDRPLVKFFFQ